MTLFWKIRLRINRTLSGPFVLVQTIPCNSQALQKAKDFLGDAHVQEIEVLVDTLVGMLRDGKASQLDLYYSIKDS